MGTFFSNLHLRKTESVSLKDIERLLFERFSAEGYRRVDHEKDADVELYLYETEGSWISVNSDLFDFANEDSIQSLCVPLSTALKTDVLAIGCVDSDFVFMNLINTNEKLDAWARVGTLYDNPFRRRSTPAGWKRKVTSLDDFKSALKSNDGFAEGCLSKIEPLLQMSPNQSQFTPELIPYLEHGKITTYYFAFPETKTVELPRLYIKLYSTRPSWLDTNSAIDFVNRGGKSRGLGIQFTGDYIEHDEITFKDVQLEFDLEHYPLHVIPVKLEKRQTANGEWVYAAEVKDFLIPEKVNPNLPPQRFDKEEYRRWFIIRFTPTGNPKKILDITLKVFPLKYPELTCVWCAWHHDKSKRDYVLRFNEDQAEANAHNIKIGIPELNRPLFDPDEYPEE